MQFGFRKFMGTREALAFVTKSIYKNIDKSQCVIAYVIATQVKFLNQFKL